MRTRKFRPLHQPPGLCFLSARTAHAAQTPASTLPRLTKTPRCPAWLSLGCADPTRRDIEPRLPG